MPGARDNPPTARGVGVDTRLDLDIARIARHSVWAHGIAVGFGWVAYVLLGLLVVAGYVAAATGRNGSGPREIAASIWTPIAAALTYVVAGALQVATGRLRPGDSLRGSVVLVHGLSRHGMPSVHVAVAAAVAVGCYFARQRLLGSLALLVALALAFDRVYVGASYPLDVAAGLIAGALVAGIGYLPAVAIFERVVRSPFGLVFASRRVRRRGASSSGGFSADGSVGARATSAGPAGMPPVLAATGAVRVLDERPVSPRTPSPTPPKR